MIETKPGITETLKAGVTTSLTFFKNLFLKPASTITNIATDTLTPHKTVEDAGKAVVNNTVSGLSGFFSDLRSFITLPLILIVIVGVIILMILKRI